MAINLRGRSFLTLKDFTSREIAYLLDLSMDLKRKKRAGIKGDLLENKNVALIFEKSSTRTRCAFTVACIDEGAHPEFLGKNDIHLGKKEDVQDTARVLGRMFDGIQFRGFSQDLVEALAKHSGVPVWNGLTDAYHPTQILADFLTIQEAFGKLKGLKLVYIGDGRNNMANSLMIGAAKVGMHCTIAAPESLFPEASLVEEVRAIAAETGAKIVLESDPKKAVKDADAIYTDVWASMGEEDKVADRIALLTPYQVNSELMSATGNSETIFLHCLPANKGQEVTEEVFESSRSLVFDEAENRLHTIKAVMVATLGK
ncbi:MULTISPECIES: ornithine carbamoyltransferase [Dethiosulfovibrio]|jgi:ornithine carbamoyltransferase|uniref:Ornithine carbamoyltransferase n=2 Tax=Dethiosulfovibrio TaxID=47054 RepID=A0ABS9EPB9_9BACT|nr:MULTISPECIES: ornithine carbamoyltransferase [Dethiosulfovibrio]MCF4113641.1 ornithine carbamoyltransferase [Dethiosulfovibrio russensis]MCF4142111.1 ornithine carbamoyltransferase [Dethiosulfovibrio marinus]MCF4144266.1 ornithine carbamoyltransferase [Dethiosulfovibrio acidaminovorans]